MAHPQEIREKLRRLYVSGEQTLETAALMCEIPQTTARAWKRADKEKGDDWDKMRAAYTLADGGIEDLSRAMLAGYGAVQQHDDDAAGFEYRRFAAIGPRQAVGQPGRCVYENRIRQCACDAGNVKTGDGFGID